MKLTKLSLAAVLPLSLMVSPCFALDCASSGTIHVEGNSSIEVMPNIAELTYSSTSENKDAKIARQNVEKTISKLVDAAIKLGIKKENIISDSLNMYPKYTYPESKKPVFQGFSATRQVTVKVEDFSLIDKITTAAIDAGISGIYGFRYDVKDQSKYKLEAEKLAITDAKEKALRLANGFDVKLGKPCSLKFDKQSDFQMYNATSPRLLKTAMVNDMAQSSAVAYSPEKQTLTSKVYATFIIEDKD
ncbi:MAG: SIMPL domain-containing protein [Aeromonadales bacterium]|nr:SIMPL domain-containing protein [Aeromonadales bacterium]